MFLNFSWIVTEIRWLEFRLEYVLMYGSVLTEFS